MLQVLRLDLEHPLRAREVAQPDLAELDDGDAVTRRVTEVFLGRERHEDLAAVRDRRQARGAVHRRSVVVAVTRLGGTRVDAHPYTQRLNTTPGLRTQSA